ncbi:hypothetical protein PISMIDRAFT_671793 [Pisolithus microcarpus 441]|uniref:Uncharacterized protein n=1 Tax=Pisolithus microcarpus 441 TaxID=765257 RepID=A0A0D0ACJ9_9AGAM|nr:hypothetical protein PISMIDRAFT_671793 [Pisolithus microcarpus 441]
MIGCDQQSTCAFPQASSTHGLPINIIFRSSHALLLTHSQAEHSTHHKGGRGRVNYGNE